MSESSRVERNRKHREWYACNESRRAEINLRRRNAYAAMDPAKKRKMLDDLNEKRRNKINATKSTLTHDINAGPSEVVLRKTSQECLQHNNTISSILGQPFVLKDCSPCTYCKAHRFQYEPPGFCCSSGQVVLVSNEMPPLLKQYFCEKDEVSRHFQACVRTYNNTFAFTSLGIHNYDKNLSRRNKGIYTFKVQGQMYHFINDLVPENQPPKNLQLYFFDTEHEVENRIKGAERMDASIVENLIDALGSNSYSQFFRNLKDISSIEDCNIIIRSNTTLDQRVYNMPTSSQVAAIWIEEQDGSGENNRDIKVFAKTGRSHSVKLIEEQNVAASLLPGGRTAHSRFKIPINADDNFVCNIGKQSAEAALLRECKLILWDEATMANRRDIENVETTLRDITNNDTIFGGKVIVFGGDFRQTLPVIRSGSRRDFIEASLVKSHKIWPMVERLVLIENMRAKEDPSFCEYLMRVGNGTEKYVVDNSIQIPRTFLVPCTNELQSFNSLLDIVFPDLMNFTRDPYLQMKRGILTPKNEFVDEINNTLIDRFPEDKKCYISYDELLDSTCKNQFADYLHTISVPGLPPHKLILKKNCPVILLRNINPAEGLCNGTRLICDDFRDHVIRCFIASGRRTL